MAKATTTAANGENAHDKKITKLVPKKTVNDLLDACREGQASIVEITTELGTHTREAQKKGLHKKAFSTIKTCDKMTPEKLAEWKEHFDDMWVKSGLEARSKSAPRFEGMGKNGESEHEEESADDAKKASGEDGARAPMFN